MDLSLTAIVIGGGPVRIAVAATEDDISASVSYYGGRAPFFLIFDEDGNLLESFPNPYADLERHAGYEVSNIMAEKGIDIMVAGLFGPMMIKELSGRGVRCVTKSGSAKDAVLRIVL